jgi:hypothetical protein
MKKEFLMPVKIKSGLKSVGFKKDWYLYQESDRVVLVDYETEAEAVAAKEMHDWFRKELTKK